MISIFYGDDRPAAEAAAKKILGADHETFDAADLVPAQLSSLFFGSTLFGGDRRILVKDLCADAALLSELPKYLDTPFTVVLLETALDQRKSAVKDLKADRRVKIMEFKKTVPAPDRFFAFDVYDRALRDPVGAVRELKKREDREEPYAVLGAWSKKALDAYAKDPRRGGRAVKKLAETDMLLKTTKFSADPWPVLEACLLFIGSSKK